MNNLSYYTVDLRNLINIYGYTRQEIESWFSSYELSDYLTESQMETIEENGTWSKEKLAKKIVDFYLMREIGLETPALFEHYAKITMERLMEKYLPIIYSNSLSYDILKNENITETINRERSEEGSNTGTSSSSSSGLTVNSDTPQRSNSKSKYFIRTICFKYSCR